MVKIPKFSSNVKSQQKQWKTKYLVSKQETYIVLRKPIITGQMAFDACKNTRA